MSLKDMVKTVKHGFGDTRSTQELLSSPRPAKSIDYSKSSSFAGGIKAKLARLRQLKAGVSAVSSAAQNSKDMAGNITESATSTPKNSTSQATTMLTGGASVAATADAAKKVFDAMDGKRFRFGVPTTKSLAGAAGFGPRLKEELDPNKLIRPLTPGSSVNPAQAAEDISKTTAAHVMKSLIPSVPTASDVSVKGLLFFTKSAIDSSPRLFAPGKTPTVGKNMMELGSNSNAVIAQSGLLQDEIFYRLVLLAENVYRPIANHVAAPGSYLNGGAYPSLTILGGFRAENTGTSAHERGEAIDLAFGTASLSTAWHLWKLAVWCRDHIMFDQLILCYSDVAGGQVWLHVSFTPAVNRRQVQTKLMNDAFIDGLALVSNYPTAQDEATAVAEYKKNAATAANLEKLLETTETAATPYGGENSDVADGFDVLSSLGTSFATGTDNTDDNVVGGPQEAPDILDVIQYVYTNKKPMYPKLGDEWGKEWYLVQENELNPDGRGVFVSRVVTALRTGDTDGIPADASWGNLKKLATEVQYNGHATDTIVWKRPNGTEAEIFVIVDNNGNLMQKYMGATSEGLANWSLG